MERGLQSRLHMELWGEGCGENLVLTDCKVKCPSSSYMVQQIRISARSESLLPLQLIIHAEQALMDCLGSWEIMGPYSQLGLELLSRSLLRALCGSLPALIKEDPAPWLCSPKDRRN